MTFDDHLQAARATFHDWLRAVPDRARVVVFCHFDADGLGAGAVFGRALPCLRPDLEVVVVPSGRNESAFTDDARDRLRALEPDALLVTDLGVNERGTLEDGVPVLYVDHHRPSGAHGDAFVISGYDWDPIPCSAWLAHSLVHPGLEDAALVEVVDWVAAVGVISDLGEKAPWPPLPAVKKRFTAKWLKETVALCNAARRAPTFDAQTALDALMTFDDPKTLSTA
ncbi:DHH family phosphoesterase, partial [Rubrivirga sp.]|uniref:DHH family phosphoesterase n=1 Tax=Rubrivirga sp. TaxID=1885344 RepID=UPI003C780E42